MKDARFEVEVYRIQLGGRGGWRGRRRLSGASKRDCLRCTAPTLEPSSCPVCQCVQCSSQASNKYPYPCPR